jgi:glycosyltransferase involved in cell wall biosynthesis
LQRACNGCGAIPLLPEGKVLKILYHHRIASKDGQAVHIEEMIAALRALSCEVIIVEPPGWSETNFGGGGSATAALRRVLPRAVSELLELSYNWFAYRRLARAIREHHPDALYERHNLYLLAGAWIKRRFGLPYLLEVNSPLHIERAEHGGLGLPSLARWLEVRVWQTADMVLPVTAVLSDIIAANGVPRQRLCVMPNGINPAMFEAVLSNEDSKRRFGCDGRLVLGFTGFVRTWHGLDQVIDYIAASPRTDLALLVIGDGPARAELLAQAARLGVADRVVFSGIVDRHRIPECVAAFDIALQPASTAYASPLKLFEYFALGRAVVAPRQPNLIEIVSDGENGILFEAGSRASLHAALDRLVGDPQLRESLGRAARRAIEERNLTWRGNAERVVALVRKLKADAHP